jgi:hypothetical protein
MFIPLRLGSAARFGHDLIDGEASSAAVQPAAPVSGQRWRRAGGTRVLLALLGVFSLIIGLYAVRHLLVTLLALALLLGIFWIISGTVELFTALSHRGLAGRGWTALMGILSVVSGIVVLAYPGNLPARPRGRAQRLAPGLRRHADHRGVPDPVAGGPLLSSCPRRQEPA